MKFEQALNESLLTEGYRRYDFSYKGTRKNYKIHDPHPFCLALDDDYKYDGNGRSILGLNLNYYPGDKDALIKEINDVDNAAGFRGFDFLTAVKEKIARDKKYTEKLTVKQRKKRYKIFKKNFPQLLKYIRRYKYIDPSEINADRQKLAKKLKKDDAQLAKEISLLTANEKTKHKKIYKQNKKIAKKIKTYHPKIAKRLTNINVAGGINNIKKVG